MKTKKPKLHPIRISGADAFVLLVSIDALAGELGKCFNDLPAKAKVRVMLLEHQLASVRKKIV